MANANLTFLTLSNTFNQWLIQDNNLANNANELRNGNYYKDNGNFTLPNGTFFITSSSGTGLSITNGALVGLLLSTNTFIATGLASFQSNVLMSNANSTTNIVGNLIVGGNTILGNVQINGTQTILGNSVTTAADLILRSGLSGSGNGGIVVEEGTTNGNAVIQFTQANSVWQVSPNVINGFYTLLTTANIADSISNNSTISVASANAVEYAYNVAVAAYAVANAGGGGGGSPYAYNQANAAYAQANTALIEGTLAYTQANLAYTKANSGAAAGGSNTQIQFNNGTSLSGSANLTFNLASNTLTSGGSIIGSQDFFLPGTGAFIANSATVPMFKWIANTSVANGRIWRMFADASGRPNSVFYLDAALDNEAGANSAFVFTRANASIVSMSYGNSIDNPIHTFYGPVTIGGVNVYNSLYDAANTCAVSNSGTLVSTAGSINFVNSPTMNAVVTLNSQGNANVAFNYNPSGGPAGPAGPTGATGATGATGPAGPSNIIDAIGSTAYNMYPVGVTGYGVNATPIVSINYLLQANGQFRAVDFAATSDASLKDIYWAIPDAIGKVQSLTGYMYKWNSEALSKGMNDTSMQVGLLAQDVQKVLPEAVSAWEMGAWKDKLSISYDRIVPLLVEAIKDQQREMDFLRNEILILKNMVMVKGSN